MVRPNILTYSSSTTPIYSQSTLTFNQQLLWDGSHIGNIKDYITIIPKIVKTIADKIVFLAYDNAMGDYAIVEKYTDELFQIEQIKGIFGVNRREFHLCTLRKRTYFLFRSYPDYENTILISSLKVPNDEQRQQIFLSWVLGVSGKLWHRNEFTFTRKHSVINYDKYDMKKATIKRFFKTHQDITRIASLFQDEELCQKVNELLDCNHNWYNMIMNRIYSI